MPEEKSTEQTPSANPSAEQTPAQQPSVKPAGAPADGKNDAASTPPAGAAPAAEVKQPAEQPAEKPAAKAAEKPAAQSAPPAATKKPEAAKLASGTAEKHDHSHLSGYHYPNKWARIILTSAEEVMGNKGVNAMLNMAQIPEYINNYPPDNMKKEFPFEGVGMLQQAIWDMYGPRGARVFAVRAGEQAFLEGLSQFGGVAAAAQVAMRVGSLEARVKLGLEFFSKFFNTVSDQVVEVDEDEKHWIWRITRCPVCWGRESEEPICHLAIGVLQAALAWTTNNRKFRLLETECIGKGDENCVILIEKVPVE